MVIGEWFVIGQYMWLISRNYTTTYKRLYDVVLRSTRHVTNFKPITIHLSAYILWNNATSPVLNNSKSVRYYLFDTCHKDGEEPITSDQSLHADLPRDLRQPLGHVVPCFPRLLEVGGIETLQSALKGEQSVLIL